MKKVIKKKKAFTLVELMGVLVIIGVLSAILIPVTSNILKENKEKVYYRQLDTIKLAAKNLGSDNMFILPTLEGEIVNVTLGQLKSLGYLDREIINPRTKEQFSDCLNVNITKINNNYEYIIDEESLDKVTCNVNNSTIAVSQPSNIYLKQKDLVSYVIIINNENSDLFKKYNIDNSKIELVGTASKDAKYSINGENNIYKITLLAGNAEGNLNVNLKSKAITDESGNDIIGDTPISLGEIYVDISAPVITSIENSYGNEWKNKNSTKAYVLNLTALEEASGIDYWAYSYNKNSWTKYPESDRPSFTTPEFTDNRHQEVYIKVCDKAGNCNDTGKSTIKIDTIAPTAPTVSLVKGDWGEVNDNTWYNFDVYVSGKADQNDPTPTSTDGSSDIAYYQISTDKNYWNTWQYSSNSSMYRISSEGTTYRHIRAVDNAGNVSPVTTKTIKIDKTAPVITIDLNTIYGEQRYNDGTINYLNLLPQNVNNNQIYFTIAKKTGALYLEEPTFYWNDNLAGNCSWKVERKICNGTICDSDVDKVSILSAQGYCVNVYCNEIYTATVTDLAGNTSSLSFTYNFRYEDK